MKILKNSFGKFAKLYTLENDLGVQLSVTDFGARIVSLKVPIDKENRELVLGFDSPEAYLEQDTYIGATIGRVAGRIDKGQYQIAGKSYQVEVQTETGHTLHGGNHSFEEQMWQSKAMVEEDSVSIEFSYFSPNQENGFNGNLSVKTTYRLDNHNRWTVSYWAKSDETTLFNPTNHVYFNLTGDYSQNISEHFLNVQADYFAVINNETLTTGEKRSVSKTPLDFRKSKKLNEVLKTDYEQNKLVKGLDHPFFLNCQNQEKAKVALVSPDKKVTIEVYTSAPAVVIFTANFTGRNILMKGMPLINHGGITLETQVAPGAEKYSDFGNIILNADENFYSATIYQIKF